MGRVPPDLRFRGFLQAKSSVRGPKIDPPGAQGRVFDLKCRSCGGGRLCVNTQHGLVYATNPRAVAPVLIGSTVCAGPAFTLVAGVSESKAYPEPPPVHTRLGFSIHGFWTGRSDFWGLAGPGGRKTRPKRWSAKRATFWKGFPGRPVPKPCIEPPSVLRLPGPGYEAAGVLNFSSLGSGVSTIGSSSAMRGC